MNLGRLLGAGALSLVALLAFLIPAHAGEAPVNVQVSKKPSSGYSSLERLRVGVGKSKVGFAQVRNRTTSAADVSLADSKFAENPSQYRVSWFKGKRPKPAGNITQQVHSEEGFNFRAKAKSSRFFSVRIKRIEGESQACIRAEVVADEATFDSAFFEVNGPACVNR